ncbi:MAG: sugar phosphate isomerase/epimerase [Planctomycetes bacterium]|nr:sugar phosphate isomerase/epimerase [Planctomycetota bacterium]
MLRYSYNTNGFAHHRLEDAVEILRELGYEGIGLTPDVHHLDPFRTEVGELRRWRKTLHGLEIVIQTGARFLLDSRRKHEPTLLSEDKEERAVRRLFLEKAIEMGEILKATAVSFWSGRAPAGADEEELWDRLEMECRPLCLRAQRAGLKLAFEPEPGMWIERVEGYEELRDRLAHPSFALALDVGHLACTGESLTEVLSRCGSEIAIVQIEDIRGAVHEHRMFGEGDLNFAEILGAFTNAGYAGLLECELSRDSHRAVECATRARTYLRGVEQALEPHR